MVDFRSRLLLGYLLWVLPGYGQVELPEDHPKAIASRQVFEQVVRAIGDGRTRPTLQVVASGGEGFQVAWYDASRHALVLEERAYDVCAALGADSLAGLAVLLGHELAHYYKDHDWVGDFSNGFADLEVGRRLQARSRQAERLEEVEAEADYFGGFYGYLAGYNTLGVAPQLLARLYAAYGLEGELEGYPSLGERQEIARRAEGKLRDLVPVFEVGTRLTWVGRYGEAGRCFDYLGREFPSREILNNAGVVRVIEALELSGGARFAYPLELDPQTRLRGGKGTAAYGYAADQEARRLRLLREAQELFDQARMRDPGYAPAYVNLSCVLGLSGEHGVALLWAEQGLGAARRGGEAALLADALIARGIARLGVDGGAVGEARRDFEEALEGNPALARLNLRALEGGNFAETNSPAEKLSPRREQIDGQSPQDYQALLDAPQAISSLPRLDQNQPAFTIYSRQSASAAWWVIDTGRATLSLLETRKGYRGHSGRGIRVGQSLAQVEGAYGLPAHLIAGRQGTCQVYPRAGIVFTVDAGGKVKGWMLYSLDE